MASTTTSTSVLRLKLLHMCCVRASFMLHPSSCAAFPFDALHVDCFAILRLQIHRQLLVVAPCCCCCWGVHWLDRNRSGQRRVVSGSRELLRRCTASVVAFKPQRSRMFGRKLAVRVWLGAFGFRSCFVADSFALVHFL